MKIKILFIIALVMTAFVFTHAQSTTEQAKEKMEEAQDEAESSSIYKKASQVGGYVKDKSSQLVDSIANLFSEGGDALNKEYHSISDSLTTAFETTRSKATDAYYGSKNTAENAKEDVKQTVGKSYFTKFWTLLLLWLIEISFRGFIHHSTTLNVTS